MRRRQSYVYGGNKSSRISKLKLVMWVTAAGAVAFAGNVLADAPDSRTSAYTPWQAQNQAEAASDPQTSLADLSRDGFDLFSLLPPAPSRKAVVDDKREESLAAVKDISVLASKRLKGGSKGPKPSPGASPSPSQNPPIALDLPFEISGIGNPGGGDGNGSGNGGGTNPSPSPSESPTPDPTPTSSPSPSQSPGDTTLPITLESLEESAEEAAGLVPTPPSQDSIWESIPQAIRDLFQWVLDRIGQFFAPDGDLETVKAKAESDAETAGGTVSGLKETAEGEAAGLAAPGTGLVTGTAASAQAIADSAPGTIDSAVGIAGGAVGGAVGTATGAAKPVTDQATKLASDAKALLENPPSAQTIRLDSTVLLNSSDANGISIPVAGGHTYSIKISGVYKYGTYISPTLDTLEADASCARPFIFDGLGGGAIGDWISNPEIHDPADPGPNHLNVLLNGQSIDWAPESPASDPLCSSNHTYTYTFTPSEAVSLMTLKVNDYGIGDNLGVLRVDIGDTFRSPTSTGQEMWPHPWGALFLVSLLICECVLRLISLRRRNEPDPA